MDYSKHSLKNEKRSHHQATRIRVRAIDGGWSEWTAWSLCSSSCERGTKVRFRFCDNPLPRDNGRQCSGEPKEETTCVEPTPCPIDGVWSEWSPWSCKVSCGPGSSFRQRSCTNPEPQHGGEYCEGEKEQSKNHCVPPRRSCYPNLPVKLETLLRHHLNTTKASYTVNATGSVTLDCGSIMKVFRRIFPYVVVLWSRNKQPIDRNFKRMTIAEDALTIRRLDTGDSGVYTCDVLYHYLGDYRVAGVFSLAVLDKPSLTIDEGDKFQLQCNDGVLTGVFSNLWRTWLLNGQVYEETKSTSERAGEGSVLTVSAARQADAGYWRCEVFHLDTNRRWITNLVGLTVTAKRKVIISDSDRLLVERLAVVFVILVLGSVLAYMVDVAERRRKRNTDKAAEFIKKIVGRSVDDIKQQIRQK